MGLQCNYLSEKKESVENLYCYQLLKLLRLFTLIECSIVKVKVDNKLASLKRTQTKGPHLVLDLKVCTANLVPSFATNF